MTRPSASDLMALPDDTFEAWVRAQGLRTASQADR